MITKDTIALLNNALGDVHLKEHEIFPFGQKEYEAELYVEANSPQDLAEIIKQTRENNLAFHIFGGGFTPGDETVIPGLVIKNNCRKFDMLSMRGKVSNGQTETEFAFVTSETGVGLNQIVRYTLDAGLEGLEKFLGIGGTVGDNLMQNIKSGEGIYLTSCIYTIQFLSKENEILEVESEPFLHPLSENMIVKNNVIPLSVVFKLVPGEKSELWKRATQAAFERNQEELTDPLKGNFNY